MSPKFCRDCRVCGTALELMPPLNQENENTKGIRARCPECEKTNWLTPDGAGRVTDTSCPWFIPRLEDREAAIA